MGGDLDTHLKFFPKNFLEVKAGLSKRRSAPFLFSSEVFHRAWLFFVFLIWYTKQNNPVKSREAGAVKPQFNGVKIKETPWKVLDDEGIESYSLLPPPVVVSLIKQIVEVLNL